MAVSTNIGMLTLAAASLLLLEPAVAQRGGTGTPAPPSTGGGTQPGGTTGRGPGQGNTTSPNNTGNQPNNNNPTPNRPIYLTGRVMTDDGSALPLNVNIERLCGGLPHIEGHTDSKGYFSIELGANNVDALQDASTSGIGDFGQPGLASGAGGFGNGGGFGNSGGINPRSLAGCELRAATPGFMSQSIELTNRQPMDNPDVGTILLHRIAGTEGSTVSGTTLNAPKNAKKALQKGLELEKKKKLDQAEASFQQAVDAYPRYAEAWFQLGRLQAAQGQSEPARKSFDEAIRADSKYVPPYIEISFLELQAQHWQQLADVSEKAVRLDPFSFPQAFFFNAVANYNLKHPDIAEQSARRAQKLDTRHSMPQVSHLLGVILADRHDYAGAAEQMRDYLRLAPQAKDAAAVRSQLEAFEKESAGAQ
ncbi:MAG TPA: tetratricopeptide repeat protein [Bryobacteraceae bacterium]|nr:tetratricopeptide repeat protein [Bryobacteraceae bacterium]